MERPELAVLSAETREVVEDLQPRIDWPKGKALMHLLKALHLDGADVLPMLLGDDLTDEDAFESIAGRGIGIVVRDEVRPTAAQFAPGERRGGSAVPGSLGEDFAKAVVMGLSGSCGVATRTLPSNVVRCACQLAGAQRRARGLLRDSFRYS